VTLVQLLKYTSIVLYIFVPVGYLVSEVSNLVVISFGTRFQFLAKESCVCVCFLFFFGGGAVGGFSPSTRALTGAHLAV